MGRVTPEIFDAVAGEYARYADDRFARHVRSTVVEAIVEALPRGASILDVGCGPGDFAIPLARAGLAVTAIDFAPRMLEALHARATREGLSVRTVELDVSRTVPDVGPHDAALSISGPLNYVPDPEAIVRNVAEVLAPGARVWFGLSRSARLPRVLRHPGRLVAPVLARSGYRLPAAIRGSSFDLYLWDPLVFARRISRWIAVDDVTALGVGPVLALDPLLGRLPGLRRAGAVSLVSGVRL